MVLEYNVSEEDYVNLNLFHIKHSKNKYRFSRTTFIIFIFIVFPLIAYQKNLTTSMPLWPLAVLFGILLAGVTYAILMSKLSTLSEAISRKIAVKQISKEKNKNFLGHQKLVLKDDCMENTSHDSVLSIRYSALEKIGFGCDCIFVYTSSLNAIIVPVSAFSSKEQENEFIEFLKQKTGLCKFDKDVIY